ncbi:DNA helicase RecQ [Rapidithrix thailandica]|uniref:DNA helicase RecQ n=1 Tax=Rapidithrix thailandica TaxID=413964 RepID=A0AAW9SIL7_9BACT
MDQIFTKEQVLDTLKQYFGYDQFRLQQEAIIQHALNKKDSLVIMPTGGGKSICYQLPSLLLDGFALVISPLIALMKDQVESLKANGIPAASFNSTLRGTEEQEIFHDLNNGNIKLLYVSPERAVSERFLNFIQRQPVSLLAIDEAHCVSAWGNDFRPEYIQLNKLINLFPNIPHMALTATADKATQKDIADQLDLKSPELFLSSFERTNLNSRVVPGQNRIQRILRYLEDRPGQPGIVYCLSRKSTEQVAEKLQNAGYKAAYYHAQMSGEQRHRIQENFQKDELQVICATIAFGMGIDKSNIRWVIHYNLPKNLESYYQEIGRAGRDGLPSDTLLFYSFADYKILREFIVDSEAKDDFKQVQLAKLNRMMEYCQATSCRTNLVLSYFGEHREESCGRCDICTHPPKGFDGTVIVQKALSACKRLKEQVNMNLLIDVLRGSHRSEIIEQGYDKIKTYGAGSNISRNEWVFFITQMINQGLFEVDYTDGSKLKATLLAQEVLFNGKTVTLSQWEEFKKASQEERKPQKSKTQLFEEGLFDALRKLRKQLAEEQGVPPYVIFSDNTLKEMASQRPFTLSDMEDVPGVGRYKLEHYGDVFLEAIQNYITRESTPSRVKGKTYLETLKLFKQGNPPEEIAIKRQLNIVTVFSHLAYLYEKGENIPLRQYLAQDEFDKIILAWNACGEPNELKPVFDYLKEQVEYYKIRLALTIHKTQ